MAYIDPELLSSLVARYLARKGNVLSPAERTEAIRIAQSISCKASAQASGISYETIRARRKRIYRKLDVPGSGELLASLLSLSLKMLAKGERIEPRPVVGQPQTQPIAGTSPVIVAR